MTQQHRNAHVEQGTTTGDLPYPKPAKETPTAGDFETSRTHPTRKAKSSFSRPLESIGYETKTTEPRPPNSGDEGPKSKAKVSDRRRRTLREAIRIIDATIPAHSERRAKALARVRRARQPVTEAKRIVASYRRKGAPDVEIAGLDLSDVQEIRARLIRRDAQLQQ